MAAALQTLDAGAVAANPVVARKRRSNHSKAKSSRKRLRQRTTPMGTAKHQKPTEKMKKLFQKRAREYNSDEEEDDADKDFPEDPSSDEEKDEDLGVGDYGSGGSEGDEEDEEGVKHGITRLLEGCRAFKVAFAKIMKRNLPDDPLGPILSAHKKLVAEKLAEEDSEQKMKGETKKQRHSADEKGHTKPDNFLDAKEKFLISVATKGVVKLFNAVSKAQSSQSGSNPSSSKDAKVLAKRRKQAFFSELHKPAPQVCYYSSSHDLFWLYFLPGWAPLRDSYMLTHSKLKDWDKMEEPAAAVNGEKVLSDSSSDDE
ncbi:RRP15-like protein [Zingiber officinale]|uniref:RRP15-like protein n=1 Tax=Zingiber officinale TaxID=94328 RepID=UPI001C4CF290|nr:RRP15-like protein [Zingiber officinale]